ncbi:MAG TPA: hypothetical protein VN253_24410 [Kofleriaceae bacterium]|nr:hypothetical protein [Kofleriaceae bacterium]
MVNVKSGALIAIAAGSLFAAACKKADEKQPDKAGETKPAGDVKAGEKTAKVNCMGINSCAGHGACKTESNGCAGQNGCSGKGFIEATEEECKAKNGTVMAKK